MNALSKWGQKGTLKRLKEQVPDDIYGIQLEDNMLL
jgi:hypothetical protein